MISVFRSIFAPPRHLILVLSAIWLGLFLAEIRVERHRISKFALNNLVYYSILGHIIGGRVLFALMNWSAFTSSPLSILSVNIDLFDPAAGIVTAVLVGLIYGWRKKLPLWSTLDALTPLFATLAVGLPLAHLAAGTAFGSPTNLPWGIELWNVTRHPTQLYDLLASLLILAWLWYRKQGSAAGLDFSLFTAVTAGTHLFLDAFRGDSTPIFVGIRLAQVTSWIVLAAALVAFEILLRKENPK